MQCINHIYGKCVVRFFLIHCIRRVLPKVTILKQQKIFLRHYPAPVMPGSERYSAPVIEIVFGINNIFYGKTVSAGEDDVIAHLVCITNIIEKWRNICRLVNGKFIAEAIHIAKVDIVILSGEHLIASIR